MAWSYIILLVALGWAIQGKANVAYVLMGVCFFVLIAIFLRHMNVVTGLSL